MKIPRCILLAAIFVAGTLTAAPKNSLTHSLPSGALAFAEIDGLAGKLQQFRQSDFFGSLLNTPQFKEFETTEEYRRAMGMRKLAEEYLEMDIWAAAEKFLGGQIAVAVYPRKDGNEPDFAAVFRTPDAAAMKEMRSKILKPILTFAGDSARQGEMLGIKLISFDESMFLALGPDWMAAVNTRPMMRKTIQQLTNDEGRSLADDGPAKKMRQRMGGKHLASLCVNLPVFTKYYDRPLETPEKLDDGGASFLFHGIIAMAASSPYFGMTLDADEKGFSLNSAIEGNPKALKDKYGWFLSDPDALGTHDIPKVEGLMGGLTIHRNISKWYGKREELLEEQLMAGFDEFESGLGNLLPGRDVGEDIMPAFGSTITFLAAKQTFDHFDGTPGVKLPGFALIFDLGKPEGGKIFQLLFQTIVTITNLAGAEEELNREPSVMTAIVHKGVPINTVQFLQDPKGKRLDISYNFMPCAMTVKGRFVFCTSLGLCKALVEEMQKPVNKTRGNRNFNLELHPEALAGLVKENRRTLVAQSIQQGKTAEKASGEIELAEKLLRSIALLRLSTSVKENGFQVQLKGNWK